MDQDIVVAAIGGVVSITTSLGAVWLKDALDRRSKKREEAEGRITLTPAELLALLDSRRKWQRHNRPSRSPRPRLGMDLGLDLSERALAMSPLLASFTILLTTPLQFFSILVSNAPAAGLSLLHGLAFAAGALAAWRWVAGAIAGLVVAALAISALSWRSPAVAALRALSLVGTGAAAFALLRLL
jgi:hypothetical protein